MSTQKRLSGSRNRCHSKAALPVTETVTVEPSAVGCTVTPVTTAGLAAGAALLDGARGAAEAFATLGAGGAAVPAAPNSRTASRSSLLRGTAYEAPGASATVTSVLGSRIVPDCAIAIERTPPALTGRVPP